MWRHKPVTRSHYRLGMTQRLVILTVMFSIGALASPARAHHSHPIFYDQCKTVTIEGRVDRIEFKDPHSLIVLTSDEGAAYTVDWAGLNGLTRTGVIGPAKDALVFGARVVVTGNPIRTAAQIRQSFPDFQREVSPNIVDPISIRRVGDSFSWALPPITKPPNCDRK